LWGKWRLEGGLLPRIPRGCSAGKKPTRERHSWRTSHLPALTGQRIFGSFGLGILLRPALSGIHIGGADIGFWFAQNGSIYVFLILIFVYAKVMNGIDRAHGVEE
jgi:putative solute:sodium symporter small subunit